MRTRPGTRFVRFAIVGLANTAVTFLIFNLCATWLGMSAAVANVLGWTAGFANSFVWNRAWTFRDRGSLPARTVLPRFALVNVVVFGVSEAVVIGGQALAQSWLPGRAGSALVLNAVEAVAIGCSFLVNFGLSSRWAFRARRELGRTSADSPGLPVRSR